MNVIMIGSNLKVSGGITRVVKNYIEAGIENKVNFEYFPTYYGSKTYVNILYYNFQYIRLFINLFILKKKYDIAHIHMSYKGSFIRKRYIINLLERKNIPVILHMHGSQFKDFYNNSNNVRKTEIKTTLNKVDVIIALGDEWKEFYETICETKVISIDNAVFPKALNNSHLEKKIYITCMGVLSKRKGTYDLIKVAEKLKGKINEKYKFMLAGDGEIQKVKNEIDRNNLNDMFIIPGWISEQKEIDEIYQKSIIYVLPSYNEGMPMSILEAMSYGVPIISTNVGSIPSVIEKENGFIVTPGDIEDLVLKITMLLNDKEKLSNIGRDNRIKVKEKYNVYDSLEKILLLYKNIIKS